MRIKLKKLNSCGFSHHLILPVLAIVAIASIGAYVVAHPKAATPNAKPGGSTSNTSVFTVLAKDMNGDGQGPVSLITSGKGKTATTYQEFPVGSNGGLVNNSGSTVQSALNSWNSSNSGKNVKFCVTAKSVGASSVLWFNSNNLSAVASDGSTNPAIETNLDLTASSSFAKYCSPTYQLSTSTIPAGGAVTMTIDMTKCQWVTSGTGGQRVCSVPSTSGPLDILSASYELQ